jgi:antitoxin ParD1/3/4
MTVKTSLSFTDRHHRYIVEKVEEGVFASSSAAVAAAIERMMEDERERNAALAGLTQEIRRRTETPREDFVDLDGDRMFDDLRTALTKAASA